MPFDQRYSARPQTRTCAVCKKDSAGNEFCRNCLDSNKAAKELLGSASYTGYLSGAAKAADYIDHWPDRLATLFAMSHPKLTKHQLRAFYGEVKRAQSALRAGQSFDSVYPNIVRLKPAVDARTSRRNVPVEFKMFIDRNADEVGRQGAPGLGRFAEHFESLVAYSEGKLKDGQ